eukprot:g9242.t1
MESLDGGFFEVRSRSGDPTTEDLHARTAQPKRFNSGKTHGLRGDRRGGDAALRHAADGAAAADCLAETETHAVVRAGGVPAAAAGEASRSSGRVLSHGWAFLCTNEGILAWEQGMVNAERTGAAVGADQTYVRLDHPTMVQELANMEPLGVPVEAADLVALTQPWEAHDGKREVLMVSPGGMARHWPDLHCPRRFTDVDARAVAPGQSVTRVVALGPTDFLCGLSKGGVLRIRPGRVNPCLIAPAKSMLGRGLSTVKRVGSLFAGAAAAATAAAPAAEPPSASNAAATALAAAAAAAAAAATPVVALAVARAAQGNPASSAPGPARVVRLTTEALEVWSVAGSREATTSLEVRHPLAGQLQRALGAEKVSLVDAAVVGASATSGAAGAGESSPSVVSWGLDLLVLAAGGEGGGALSVHAVRVSSEEASWVGSSVSVKVGDGSGTCTGSWGGGGVFAHIIWPSESGSGSAAVAAQVWSMCVKMGGGGGGHVEWEERGSVEVSNRAALVGGCVGGGGALLGCPGVLLLGAQAQAVWVAPRHEASGLAVDLGLSERALLSLSATGDDAAAAEDWRLAVVNEGLSAFEAGKSMDTARLAVVSKLSRTVPGAGGGSGAVSGGLDTAIVEAGLEVLNGSWRHPSAFTSPQQLVHLALEEKARRHRALVRFLMDAGAWGSAATGRAALAEGGEKIAAAARLCQLQDAISRESVGAKAAGLLDNCVELSLEGREERRVVAAAAPVASPRDRYFQHTQGVLDALLELHTPRLDDHAPSSSIDGAMLTPLTRGLQDPYLAKEDRLPLLNQLSVVVAGVFEAALRHRVSERSVYRAGLRGELWTASREARLVLSGQLRAYGDAFDDGVNLQSAGGGRHGHASTLETTRGVIGRLSVLLLDGFKEEEEANPVAPRRVEWQGNYLEAKSLCVRVVAAFGRDDLARSLADKHGYLDGTVALCHEAELRKPGCEAGHRLLRQKMGKPQPSPDGHRETQDAKADRESFARFVLDWHLRRGLKTALLDVGAAVPDILREFLADWREAELLWMFQIRVKDYTGAGQALTKGSPPANQMGGRCEAQHLWLSLAKLACLAAGGSSAGGNAPAPADAARRSDIQRRLELAEVRERLVESRLSAEGEAAMDTDDHNNSNPWTWEYALDEATQRLNSISSAKNGAGSDQRRLFAPHEVEQAADIAFQGYKALVAGLPESHGEANRLWSEVVGLTLADDRVGEAVAKGAMPTAAEDDTAATDREMETVWKRPTVLHLLLRAIQKDRRLRREAPWAGGTGFKEEEEEEEGRRKIDLTDESLLEMMNQHMPAGADKHGATREAWIAAIRKCPW